MTLDELIAALEAAEGPSAELDRALAVVGGHKVYNRGKLGWTWRENGTGPHYNVPRYTASLDAAVSLVPARWEIKRIERVTGGYEAALWCPVNPGLGAPYRAAHRDMRSAIVIAALRARSRA